MANDSWISFSHFQCVSERMYEETCLPFLSFSFSSFERVMPPFPVLPSAFLRVPCCLHWLALLSTQSSVDWEADMVANKLYLMC